MKSWLLLALIAGAVLGGIALDKWFGWSDRKIEANSAITNQYTTNLPIGFIVTNLAPGVHHVIATDGDIVVTNSFEFAFRSGGKVRRTHITEGEHKVISEVVLRAIPDGGTAQIDHRYMGKDEFGRPRLHYTTNVVSLRDNITGGHGNISYGDTNFWEQARKEGRVR